MEKHMHRVVDGPSRIVDRPCCGEPEAVAGDESCCTLTPSEMPKRIARWQAILATTQDWERTAGSAVFHFDDTPHSRSELEALVALEHKCCGHVSWHVFRHASRRRGRVSNRLTLSLKSDEPSLQSILKRLLPSYPRSQGRATR